MSEKMNEKIDSLEEMDQVAGGAGIPVILKGFPDNQKYSEYVCPFCKQEYKIPTVGFAGLLQCSKCHVQLRPK